MLLAYAITVSLALAALAQQKGLPSPIARRGRRRMWGLILLMSGIPAWLFLERRVTTLIYAIVLLCTVGLGVLIYSWSFSRE